MKSLTKLKYLIGESPPQAKFVYTICDSRTHIINGIVNGIEIQKRRNPAADGIFYNICHRRTQIIIEIMIKIECRSYENPSQAKILQHLSQ